MRKLDPDRFDMPWYYYAIAIIIMLVISYIGLYYAGEVKDPIHFLLNLRHRHL